jgi:hypothetical protein
MYMTRRTMNTHGLRTHQIALSLSFVPDGVEHVTRTRKHGIRITPYLLVGLITFAGVGGAVLGATAPGYPNPAELEMIDSGSNSIVVGVVGYPGLATVDLSEGTSARSMSVRRSLHRRSRW